MPDAPKGVLCLGADKTVPLGGFLKLLGMARRGRQPWILGLPAWPLLAVLAPLSRISAGMAFLRERLLGIQALPTMDTETGNRLARITLRPLDLPPEAAPTAARRALLREGMALLSYVFSGTVSRFAVRRWLRLLPADTQPLSLPAVLTARPYLLRLVDPLPLPCGPRGVELSRRLHLALLVGEVSGPSAQVVTPRRGGRMVAWFDLAMAGLGEAVSVVPRLLVHLAWWRR
jgi:hypothetical protein